MSDRRGGAPRSEAARVAILESASRIFLTRGYDALSMEGIAHEAGVGKQTIYRWWGSKGAVIAECLLDGRLVADRLAIPHESGVSADLTHWTEQVFHLIGEPIGEDLLRSLIAAGAQNAEVGRRIRDSLGGDSTFIARLEAAVVDGELRADAPLVEIADALVGSVLLHALSRTPAEEAGAARIVAVALGGSLVR